MVNKLQRKQKQTTIYKDGRKRGKVFLLKTKSLSPKNIMTHGVMGQKTPSETLSMQLSLNIIETTIRTSLIF